MTEQKVHFVTVEMSSLDEYSQRELNAYRNIGTLRELRRIKHEEMNRKERQRRFRKTIDTIVGAAIVLASIEALFFICLLLS